MNNSKKQYEEYLNDVFNEMGWNDTWDDLIYLTSKLRGNLICSQVVISNAYHNRKIGKLLRKYDSVRFETGYNDWKKKNEYHNKK